MKPDSTRTRTACKECGQPLSTADLRWRNERCVRCRSSRRKAGGPELKGQLHLWE